MLVEDRMATQHTNPTTTGRIKSSHPLQLHFFCCSGWFAESSPLCQPNFLHQRCGNIGKTECAPLVGCRWWADRWNAQCDDGFFKSLILLRYSRWLGFTQVGLLEKSQDMYARAYDIQSAKLGPEHADVAYTMNHTAGLLKVMGKFGDAESVYRAVGGLLQSFPL